ncbi:MAG TPA: TonB-dependent receptor plug domain-containing protein [Chitinophaga sp.]|uniref:TonB-dependent receptor plug domain-containing protein n=1 Tax=Chitinophaga sp. TaxID=1869181 RepID=UPI002C158C68|nr:TonB-dependent receptor plug domain-containing protein [Chitinophaga sp.]HVI47471.1 TonB-dependent receptor plug domain-containing protein [Chitinophaga sp.]
MQKYLITVLLLLPGYLVSAQDNKDKKDSTRLPGTRALKMVTVSAGAFEASDKAKGASLTPIDAVTVAGSYADITQALRSLPGAQQIGEQEGLFVRGGTSYETKQFIDGTLLKYPNYPSVPGITQYARINPFLFKGILFSSGGYSALYGQAMSSALIMESVDMPEKSSASFSLFPANIGTGFQKLGKGSRSSFGASLSYSNQSWYNNIIQQRPDYFSGPEYLDGNANFRIRTGKTGILKFYTNWSSSNVGMYNPDIDSAALRAGYLVKGRNGYNSLSYRTALTDKWKVDVSAAYTYNHNTTATSLTNGDGKTVILHEEPYQYKNRYNRIRSDFAQGRIVFTHILPGNQTLRFGAEHFYTNDKGVTNDSLIRFTDQLTAAFAEGDLYVADNIAAKAGARLEHSTALNKWVVAPRLSVAYMLKSGGQFNLAYGIFYQEPQEEFMYYNRNLTFSSATHYVLNYTRKENNRFFRVEAYYKQYRDLIKIKPQEGNGGKGYAKGIELFFRDKKTIRNLDYWITYTYLDTRRDFQNYPYELKPTFAAPHTATIAIKKSFPDINAYVNVSYAFAAGRPYYDIRFNVPDNKWQVYDDGTTKNYSVVNLHVAYLTPFFKHWKQKDFSGIAFGVNNLLGTKQVFGYNYSFDGSRKVPMTLPASRYYFIGFFMNFGIDRTNDILDNL